MTLRALRILSLLLTQALATTALTSALAPALAQADEDEATSHFRTGVRLYQSRNFIGALAEFEEALRLRPTASSLQNIALCQRELFRYAEAIATLEQMLSIYGSSLSAQDSDAARATIDELRPLVATVTLVITPPDAHVSIDGQNIAGAGTRAINLNVGEHRIIAEAPLYRRLETVVAFAGGARRVDLTLEADMGHLRLTADDPEATIIIDGVPRGAGVFDGDLPAGTTHRVQLQKAGFETSELQLVLSRGERKELTASLGDAITLPIAPAVPVVQPRGWYGFLTATNYFIANDPDGFSIPKEDSGGRDGAFFGLRAGYRVTNNFGLELLFESGKHTVGPGCYTPSNKNAECLDTASNKIIYDRWAQHFGMGSRVWSNGNRFRFIGTGAIGAVHHTVEIPESAEPPNGTGSGVNAFLMLEGGIELQFRKVLVDGVLACSVDGASNILSAGKSGARFYTADRNVVMAGLGLRVGWGQW